FPAPLSAHFPDPAASHRLAVAWRSREKHAALGTPAVSPNPLQIRALQIANCVLPEQIELIGWQHRSRARRFLLKPALQRDPVESAIIFLIDGDKVQAPAVVPVVVDEADPNKFDSLNLVDPHTQLNPRIHRAVIRIPVANQYAIDWHQFPA